MKRIFSMLLCMALVLTMLPVAAFAEEAPALQGADIQEGMPGMVTLGTGHPGAWRGPWETIGTSSDGFLYGLRGIAADSAGNVYAADYQSARVRKFDAVTGLWTNLPNQPFVPASDYPWGVAVDSSGNVYVVNSINANGTNGVWKYAGGVWTDITHGAHFHQPQGIAVDKNGNVYVADTENRTIMKLPSGSSSWTIIGDDTLTYGRSFNRPIGIATDQSNNVYVTEKDVANRGQVYRLPSGSSQWTALLDSPNNPQGIAADGNGNVYVLDGTGVLMWPVSGTNVFYFISGNPDFTSTYGLAIDGSGSLYVTGVATNTFGLISMHQGWATQLEWGTHPGGGGVRPKLRAAAGAAAAGRGGQSDDRLQRRYGDDILKRNQRRDPERDQDRDASKRRGDLQQSQSG